MYQAPEQLMHLNKTNLDAAVRFAGIALESAERMLEAQTKAVKSALAESTHQVKVLSAAKDFAEFSQHSYEFAQPKLEKTSSYIKNVCDVAAVTQADMSELLERQITALNERYVAWHEKMMKWIPVSADVAGANLQTAVGAMGSACGKLSKSAKQIADITHASAEAAIAPPAAAGKKNAA